MRLSVQFALAISSIPGMTALPAAVPGNGHVHPYSVSIAPVITCALVKGPFW